MPLEDPTAGEPFLGFPAVASWVCALDLELILLADMLLNFLWSVRRFYRGNSPLKTLKEESFERKRGKERFKLGLCKGSSRVLDLKVRKLI